jgi:S1-C subfamily serine protease
MERRLRSGAGRGTGSLAAAALLALAACGGARGPVRPLVPGEPQVVDHARDDPAPLFRVRVPPGATALRLTTSGATHDLELYGRFGSWPEPGEGAWDVVSSNLWIDEELLIDVTDARPLEPGNWYFVLPPGARDLVPEDRARVRYLLAAELVVPEPAPLALGEIRSDVLRIEDGLRRAYRIELPDPPPERLRLEVHSPDADVDVVAGPAAAARTLAREYARSETDLNFERLVLETSAIDDGLVVHAYALPAREVADRLPVRVLVAVEERGAPTLCPPPQVPVVPDDPLGRAVAATVVIYGPLGAGSGVVVSPEGHVVTNAHVVAGAGRGTGPLADLAVGFTLDPRRAPETSLGAELLDYREDLDLALLRISSTLDRRPLPAGLRFPHLTLDRAEEPALGSVLYGIGYPMTGGAGSFVTVSVTRGIVSGFTLEAEGRLVKTDAAIHSGISGGACVDATGRLVGFPSQSVRDANAAGGLGFLIPIDEVPREWFALVGRD